MSNPRVRPKDQVLGVLRFFGYDHLPPAAQAISRPFAEMAERIVETIPYDPEREVALRKLLEAKDCTIRAFMVTRG